MARAGVSRGAQVHHFPTKEDLVLAAVEHLCERRLADYRAAFARLPDSGRTAEAAFDLLRSQCVGPAMDAWFELAVAARTNAALHERFVAVDRRFWDAALANLQEMFPEAAADPALANLALRLSFCVVDGLSLGRLLDVDPAELDAVADTFKLLIAPYTFRPQETPA